MNRTIRRYLGAVLAVSLLSATLGSGTGPGTDNPVTEWEWCIQESTKAAVWYSKLPAEQGVVDAYRTCRPDFKAVLDKILEAEAQSAFLHQVAADHAERVNFARQMFELGNPHDQ